MKLLLIERQFLLAVPSLGQNNATELDDFSKALAWKSAFDLSWNQAPESFMNFWNQFLYDSDNLPQLIHQRFVCRDDLQYHRLEHHSNSSCFINSLINNELGLLLRLLESAPERSAQTLNCSEAPARRCHLQRP